MDSEMGVTVGDCAKMSEEISVHLDVINPIKGSYILEVSSPGLDRPLKKERDFRRSIGKKVHARLKIPYFDKKEILGKLVNYENDVIFLQNGKGKTCEIPLQDVQQIRLRF
jgi:ribosome maturation factor RimP